MILSELFDRLALGELSQHRYGSTGEILIKDYPAIIHQVNTGLTALHAYFPLKEKEVVIQQYALIQDYKLAVVYAQSNDASTEEIKYILDSVDKPFVNDLIRINAVYDGIGTPIPLNVEHDPSSWFTPAWNTLQIPNPVADTLAVVLYRAKHPTIAKDAPMDTEIDIPFCLEEALQAYIASRCFVSLGNQAGASLSNYYDKRYRTQVIQTERDNLLQSSTSDSNSKLDQKGFI